MAVEGYYEVTISLNIHPRFDFDTFLRDSLMLSAKNDTAMPTEALLLRFGLYLIFHIA
jgi:hypothetical protein